MTRVTAGYVSPSIRDAEINGVHINNGDTMTRTYQVARPLEQLTPVKIISAIEKSDGATIDGIGDTAFMRKYTRLLESAEKSKENSQEIK